MRYIFTGSKILLVPIKEMTDVLAVKSKAIELSRDTWVRMKIGTYKGDLAKVPVTSLPLYTYSCFLTITNITRTPCDIGCGCGQCAAEGYCEINTENRLTGFGKQIGTYAVHFSIMFQLLDILR